MKAKLSRASGLAVLACAFAAPLAATKAVAQSSEGSSRRVIEEVVVTARRREETAQEVPIAISAMSAEQLQDRGITEIKEIERITPNLSFTECGINRSTAQTFFARYWSG